MIISELIPLGLLKTKLEKYRGKEIAVVSCNACARVCGCGGEEVAQKLAEELANEGFRIKEVKIVPVACNLSLCKKAEISADVLLVLGCEAAGYALKSAFPEKEIVMGARTIALGVRDEEGHIYEVVPIGDR